MQINFKVFVRNYDITDINALICEESLKSVLDDKITLTNEGF